MASAIIRKLRSKRGNSFLFTPFIVLFGCAMIYMFTDMGSAYARSIEIQTVADATARAGVFAGMNGKYTQYVAENESGGKHVYVMLDGGTALGAAREVAVKNLEVLSIDTGDTVTDARQGRLFVGKSMIHLCNVNDFAGGVKYKDCNTIPMWNRDAQSYDPVYIESFNDAQEVLKSGNFFVTIKGEYRTIMANFIIGKQSIHMNGFASAIATAQPK